MIGLLMLASAHSGSIYTWCKAPEVSLDGLACTTFVDGVIRGSLAVTRFQNGVAPFCIPKEARQRERELTVVAYLDRNPNYHDRDSAEIVVAAMRDAYPCAASQQNR